MQVNEPQLAESIEEAPTILFEEKVDGTTPHSDEQEESAAGGPEAQV